MIGREFGRYEILSSLGRGGMGSVWRARDRVLGRDVAIKIVGSQFASSAEACARLLREAKTASRLDHPNIAAVLDAGEANGEIYIAFELITGSTLKETCGGKAVEIEQALAWIRDICGALEHAHQRGVLHRDVTARNIMVDANNRAILLDFGLATRTDTTRTLATQPLGTAGYIAPEVTQGEPATARSDIYSLAIVLYELVAGRMPFEGERVEALIYATVHSRVEPASRHNPSVPATLDQVLARGLAKTPAERFGSASEFKDALQLERPDGQSAGTLRNRTRVWPRSTIARAGILGLLLVLGAWLLLQQIPSDSRNAPEFRSVAVIPLSAVAGAPTPVLGIAEAVLASVQSKLNRFTALRVIPWSTSLRGARQAQGIAELARSLGVEAVVGGQVAETNDRIYGSIALFGGFDGALLWTLEFDEPFDKLVELERMISEQVAAQLQEELSRSQREGIARPVAEDSEAFQLYVQGAMHLQDQSREGARKAQSFFQRALDRDPSLARAHVGLGAIYAQAFWFAWSGGYENLALAEQRFARALELDSGLLDARIGLINVAWYRGLNERCLQQGQLVAATGREDLDAVFSQALAYLFGGLAERSLALFRRVLELDPENERALWHYTFASLWANDPAECIRSGNDYLFRFGEDAEIRLQMGSAYIALGRLPIAKASIERARSLYGEDFNWSVMQVFAQAYHLLGDDQMFRSRLGESLSYIENRLLAYSENVQLHGTRAYLCALAGNLACLEESMAFVSTNTNTIDCMHARALAIVGLDEEAREAYRDCWSSGMFNEMDLGLMRESSYEYFPAFGALLGQAEEIRAELMARYTFGLNPTP